MRTLRACVYVVHPYAFLSKQEKKYINRETGIKQLHRNTDTDSCVSKWLTCYSYKELKIRPNKKNIVLIFLFLFYC